MDSKVDENVCRLCTNRGKDYHSIFDSNSTSIAEKICNCLPIEIRENDKLPSHICSACLNALNISDKLRAQSLVADEILRQQLTIVLIDKIKQEKDDESQEMDTTTERLFCGICEVNFDDMNDFDDHMKALHSSQWICNLCNEDCKTSEDLIRHKYKEHYDSIEHSKEADDKAEDSDNSSGDEDMSDHFVNVNESIDIKDEDLPSNSRTTEVTVQRTGKRNIICDLCNVTISTEKLMAMHVKMHEPRQISCATCFREFPSPYDLLTHKQTVHKVFVDQKMKWFCDKCERFTVSVQFLRLSSLDEVKF